MDTLTLANEICDQADGFLADVKRRDEAKVVIAEYLTIHHATLPAAEKQAVIAQTLKILEEEDFFIDDHHTDEIFDERDPL